MASLYQIDEKLMMAFNYGCDEDGVILEEQELNNYIESLTMQLDNKVENIALYIKNLESDAEQIKQEKMKLQKRQQVAENHAQYLKKYLANFLQYHEINKFETPKCKVSFRKSTTVEITDLEKIPQEFIKPRKLTDNDVNKTDIKDYLKKHQDETIDGINIKENQNISIK